MELEERGRWYESLTLEQKDVCVQVLRPHIMWVAEQLRKIFEPLPGGLSSYFLDRKQDSLDEIAKLIVEAVADLARGRGANPRCDAQAVVEVSALRHEVVAIMARRALAAWEDKTYGDVC